jgi:hypothetical protein
MSFREKVTEEVREAAQNNGDSGSNEEQETLEQIEVDMGSIPFVKFYPTTLVSGVFPENEGNPIIRFPDAGNNDGRRDQGYLGIVLDDLEVLTDEEEGMSEATFVETDADDSTEYRAVNFADDSTTEKFGGSAVSIDGDQYGIEDTTTRIDGRAILVVDRTASLSVARKLDVNGDTFAGMDEETGDVNGGLIEYALTGENGENVDIDGNEVAVGSRYARNPELRDGLYGERVGFMVTRRSEADAGATGYTGRNGQHDEPVVGVGEGGDTHTDPTRATFEELTEAYVDGQPERRDMMWYSVFNMETGEALQPVSVDDEAGSEPTSYSFLEWRFDPTAGNLPDKDWEFVQEYIEAGLPDDEDTILQNIEDNAGELSEDPNTERMVGLIQNEAGQ